MDKLKRMNNQVIEFRTKLTIISYMRRIYTRYDSNFKDMMMNIFVSDSSSQKTNQLLYKGLKLMCHSSQFLCRSNLRGKHTI